MKDVFNILLLEMGIFKSICIVSVEMDELCMCVFVCPYYCSSSFWLMLTFLTEKHAIPDGALLSLSLSLSLSMFSANSISLMTYNSKINVNNLFLFMPEIIREREGETR